MALPGFLPRVVSAQGTENPIAPLDSLDPMVWVVTQGATIRKGKVEIELPQLAENGNSVLMRLTVDSPMTQKDHVKAIHLFSERNPVRNMASFYLGPRAGRAEIVSRVRLAGSQRVVALAELSDGTFWSDSAAVVVTISACLDES
jgi:sulfur-oxidizing protein SoxY